MDTLVASSKLSPKNQDILINTHFILVKRIAHHLLGRLPQSVQVDDLIQAGMIGLLEAAKNYDPAKGASFETYAGIRIKGNMLDEVRRNDWVPRSVYRNSRKILEVIRQVEHKIGREAKDSEIAGELGLSVADYHKMLQDSSSSHVYGFEELGVTDDVLPQEDLHSATEPHLKVLHNDLMTHLTQVISHLPPKERLVLSLYYERDLNLKEIGEVLEVSESRVSQILTQATLRVRARFPN